MVPLRLLSPGFGYPDFLGRSCRGPFGGDQNASICLVSKQSEQLRLFLVGLRKRQSAVSGGAIVAHGYAPPNAILTVNLRTNPGLTILKSKAPEIALRGPTDRRGTSALRPLWRPYWHGNRVCQSRRLGS